MNNNYANAAGCSCCARNAATAFPEEYSVAMAYVPLQTDLSVYDEMKSLEVGTLFPVLNKPFNPARCSR